MTAAVPDCPECGQQTPDQDVILVGNLCECRTCGVLFPCDQGLNDAFPQPRGARLRREEGRVVLERAWFHRAYVYGLLYTLAIPAISGSVFMMPTTDSAGRQFYIFLMGLLAILAVYWVLMMINKTTVVINDGVLLVHRRPIPWPADQVVPRHRMRGFYVKRRDPLGVNLPKYRTYQVLCRVAGAHPVLVLRGLARAEEAVYYLNQLSHAVGERE